MAARRVMAAAAAAFFLASGPACAAGVRVVDDRGVVIAMERPAARLITLSPHLTELVYAAGAGDRLVGVPLYSDYPPQAEALPHIGDATRVDLERVLALRPDLVLAWKSGNSMADVARLERLHVRVYVSDAPRLADVARVVRTIGELAGTGAAARGQAAAFERDIDALRRRHAASAPLRVFYQIWDRPLLTVNGGHIISDVIALCGGRNVFADADLLTPAVSLEALIAAQPQLVLGGSSALTSAEFSAQWRSYRVGGLARIPVGFVPPDFIQRPTPRIAAGARVICERMQEVRSARGGR